MQMRDYAPILEARAKNQRVTIMVTVLLIGLFAAFILILRQFTPESRSLMIKANNQTAHDCVVEKKKAACDMVQAIQARKKE
jgi:hypothetical protein